MADLEVGMRVWAGNVNSGVRRYGVVVSLHPERNRGEALVRWDDDTDAYVEHHLLMRE